MADSKITQKQYWEEVTSIAKEVIREARETGRGERARERAHDYLHEFVDGHEWIIYTWAYPYVLIHSKSEDALFDELGPQEASSYSDIMQKMAFYALYTDAMNELSGMLDELDDDDDED